MQNYENYLLQSLPLLEYALTEDIGSGDITTESIISKEEICNCKLIAKNSGIVAGIDVFKKVFELIDYKGLAFSSILKDGSKVLSGDLIAEFSGSFSTVLKGERTALNFLQRMSGIATKTNQFVEILKPTNTLLLDTRKTVPGFRYLDKYAVKIGGGTNHRFGLFDMVMIKENHIKAAGSIKNAMMLIRDWYGEKFKVEIETSCISEVVEVLKYNPDIIMLDNMSAEEMKSVIKLINGKAKIEASGNVSIKNLREIAECGVDYISVGALTHSVNALDISLLIN